MKPTPQQLVAFLRVAETGSFSRAAGALGISQPSLSRTIKAIESAIGALVFNRDTRNVELTSVGAELRLIASRMVKEYEGALSELTQFVEGQRGQITVAALPSISAVLLPRALVCFRETNPGIDVAIRDSLSQPVLHSVLDGSADLGLTVRPAPSAKLTYKPLVEDEFCLVCRKDDPLTDSESAAWSVFAQHPFIAMSPASSATKRCARTPVLPEPAPARTSTLPATKTASRCSPVSSSLATLRSRLARLVIAADRAIRTPVVALTGVDVEAAGQGIGDKSQDSSRHRFWSDWFKQRERNSLRLAFRTRAPPTALRCGPADFFVAARSILRA